jgi:hypothetical protein
MKKQIKRYVPYGINGEYFVYDNILSYIPLGHGTGGTKKKIKSICEKLNKETD